MSERPKFSVLEIVVVGLIFLFVLGVAAVVWWTLASVPLGPGT